MIRIALVDDHSLFRKGLKVLLSSRKDLSIVADVGSGEEFLEVLMQAQPDVVFMDYSMPQMNGAETTRRALEMLPDLKIITLSMFGDNAYYSDMMSSGAKGFLLKDSEFTEVVEAVETVFEGGTYFSASLLESLSHSMRSTGAVGRQTDDIAESDRLSEREVEVLLAICQGFSTQEIADRMFISKRTVDKHRANILDKSGCKNTASLVVYAIRNGFVEI
jgi:DNA-binding NarL/FixJ family response regulator